MSDLELFLKKAIKLKNEHNSVYCMPLELRDREIVMELERKGLIKDVRYMAMAGVGFDLTDKGVHYFD